MLQFDGLSMHARLTMNTSLLSTIDAVLPSPFLTKRVHIGDSAAMKEKCQSGSFPNVVPSFFNHPVDNVIAYNKGNHRFQGYPASAKSAWWNAGKQPPVSARVFIFMR